MAAVSVDEQRPRILDQLLDLHQELHGFRSVDDAVVVGEGDIHHRANHYLTAERHRAILDRVKAEDADLRRVEDWRAEERAEDAAVGDGERAALEIGERE